VSEPVVDVHLEIVQVKARLRALHEAKARLVPAHYSQLAAEGVSRRDYPRVLRQILLDAGLRPEQLGRDGAGVSNGAVQRLL
jgi:hypothetical protein